MFFALPVWNCQQAARLVGINIPITVSIEVQLIIVRSINKRPSPPINACDLTLSDKC
jgi:hypothetical protein